MSEGEIELPRGESTANWMPVADGLPDQESTVLIVFRPAGDADEGEEVMPGYLLEGLWHSIETDCPLDGTILRWANYPDPKP